MPATVRLSDIIEALDTQFDEYLSFVDRETGQVETVSRDLLCEAEDSDEGDPEPDLPAWQKDVWEVAKRIVSSSSYERLPTKEEVDEWTIMEEFSQSVESDRIREDLLRAIHGSGAFRYFKDTIRRHGIEKDWHAFRDDTLREIAINWCEENGVAWK